MKKFSIGPLGPLPLVSLAHHNRLANLRWIDAIADSAHANGIACPECGAELPDTNPSITSDESPPQKAIHCKCGFRGRRVA
jgi:hypothetical protein